MVVWITSKTFFHVYTKGVNNFFWSDKLGSVQYGIGEHQEASSTGRMGLRSPLVEASKLAEDMRDESASPPRMSEREKSL